MKILETSRLMLREFIPEDAEQLNLVLSDPETMWGLRDYEHRRAVQALKARTYNGADPLRASAYPKVLDPFHWDGVVETPAFFALAPVDSLAPEVDPGGSMPAQMLECSTPAARQKGRLQEGADADIVVFDPQTIADRSTFEKPMEPSVGVHYLLVGGTPIIDDGKLVPDIFPGRALVGPGRH